MTMYAIALASGDYITKGTKVKIIKLYDAFPGDQRIGRQFDFYHVLCDGDQGYHYGLEHNCSHLDRGSWEIIEEDDDGPK